MVASVRDLLGIKPKLVALFSSLQRHPRMLVAVLIVFSITGYSVHSHYRESLLEEAAEVAESRFRQVRKGTLLSASPADAVLLHTYARQAGIESVSLFHLKDRAVSWERPLTLTGEGKALIQSTAELIFFVDDATLRAIHRRTGEPAWQATMSDRIACSACLHAVRGFVVVLTLDGRVQGISEKTGEIIWNRRLNQAAHWLDRTGDTVVTVDEQEGGAVLLVMDPQTGKTIQQMQPRCNADPAVPARLLRSGDHILTPDELSPQILFIFASAPGCIQSYDSASGTLQWQTLLQKDMHKNRELRDGDSLLLANSSGLYVLHLRTGHLRLLTSDQDYAFKPLSILGTTAVIQAEKKRGTKQYELRGIDMASGSTLWRHAFDAKTSPLPGGEKAAAETVKSQRARYLAGIQGEHLVIVTGKASPGELAIETLDVHSGKSSGERHIWLPGADKDKAYDLALLAWRDGEIVLILNQQLLLLDIASATAFTWSGGDVRTGF